MEGIVSCIILSFTFFGFITPFCANAFCILCLSYSLVETRSVSSTSPDYTSPVYNLVKPTQIHHPTSNKI